jgi:hypothetical protein
MQPELHLPHLALPQALAWDVHTYAYRRSGQRIDLVRSGFDDALLATAAQRTLWCLACPRHALVGLYPRSVAMYHTVLVCLFGPSAIGILALTRKLLIEGGEDAWDGGRRLQNGLTGMCALFVACILASMITGRPRTALILPPWFRISVRAWGGRCASGATMAAKQGLAPVRFPVWSRAFD